MRVIMHCMKRICLTGCVIAAFVLSACSQVEQPQPGVGPNPVAPAEDEETTPTEESDKEEETKAADAEQDGEKEHVCSDLMSCKLGLCPNGKKRSETAANEEQEEVKTEEEENITPSEEQMEAARALMAENNKKKKNSAKSRRQVSALDELVESHPQPEPVVVSNTSGIPGRSGLRMGRFAPPEEAISKGDGDASQPNAAERHGLRSPSLPKSLPMNIDGKTHAH